MTKANKHAGFLKESMTSVNSGTTRDLARTACAPQRASTDAGTGITSFIRGSSKRLITSSGLEWEGVSLELHTSSHRKGTTRSLTIIGSRSSPSTCGAERSRYHKAVLSRALIMPGPFICSLQARFLLLSGETHMDEFRD
jgi:hypothetical protein